jgi:hypothetical protein
MPDGTINIYIDSSFVTVTGGSTNAFLEYRAAQADNFGYGMLQAYYTLAAGVSGSLNYLADFFASSSGTTTSGYINAVSDLTLSSSGTLASGGLIVCLTDYSIPTTSSGKTNYIDSNSYYYTGITKTSGSQDGKVGFTAGSQARYFKSYISSLYSPQGKINLIDLESYYAALSGTQDLNDLLTYLTLASGLQDIGNVNAFIESFFAGYVLHDWPADIICGLAGFKFASDFDVELAKGWAVDWPSEIICGIPTGGMLAYFDAHAGVVMQPQVDFDVELVLGRIEHIYWEVYCGLKDTKHATNFEVSLLSLKISDLSIVEGQYVNADGTLCVDITDDVYNVVAGGCYFTLGDTVVSGILTTIDGGYRLCYNPVDSFASILDTVVFTARAENDHGDVLTKDFYLTSGYVVEYDNVGQDYGWGNKIIIRMAAENFASCPKTGVFAYEVETVAKESRDLIAIITGWPVMPYKDLPAIINPHSTAFFYGKTFRVELRAKDYSGNEMVPFVFEFKIEDKPN